MFPNNQWNVVTANLIMPVRYEYGCIWGLTLQYHPAIKRQAVFAGDALNLFLGSRASGNAQEERVWRNILALKRGPIRYRRNRIIVNEGDPADYVFLVVSGVVRSCKVFQNGTRSIIAFHMPGELFGWTAEATHRVSIEAASHAVILFIKRSALLATVAHNAAIANFLLASTANELKRVQDRSLMIARDAKCRLASFLTDLAARTGQSDQVDLPMTYNDIADYLGLTIETVSRTMNEFERSGSIARRSCRALVLNYPASLAKMLN